MSEWITLDEFEKSLKSPSGPQTRSSEEGLPDNHVLTIRERELEVDRPELIQNNIQTDTVTLNLDLEWEGITPLILFGSSEDHGVFAVSYANGPTKIPARAMEYIGPLDVSVMGLDAEGEVRLVTKAAHGLMNVVESGEYIGEITEDDAELLGQMVALMAEMQELKKRLEDILASGAMTDYNALSNKPQIEGVSLTGNKAFSDLGLRRITETEIDNLTV